MDMVMDMERTEDFKTLRAKFQNDSNFSNALLTSAKKPSVAIRPWQSSDGSPAPSPKAKPLSHIKVPEIIPQQRNNGSSPFCPKPKPLSNIRVPEIIPRQSSDGSSPSCPKLQRQVQIPIEEKAEKISYIPQKYETMPAKPRALPRIRLQDFSNGGMINDRKEPDFPQTLGKGTVLVADLPKQHLASCVYPQETNITFHNTRKIWESASSLKSNQKSSPAPPQCPNRTTSLAYLNTANDVSDVAKDKATTADNEEAITNPSQWEGVPIVSPPVPPRNHTNIEKVACEAVIPTDFPTNINGLNKANMAPECSNVWQSPLNSGQHHDEKSKLPKTKSLPSIISLETERRHEQEENELPKIKPLPSSRSLGPPPKKPPRPLKVDLSIFRTILPEVVDDEYMTPEIAETEGLSMYEETIPCLAQSEGNSNAFQEAMNVSNAGKKAETKKHFLVAIPSNEKKNTKERGPLCIHDIQKPQTKEIGKISDHGTILAKPKINGEYRGEKHLPQEQTLQPSPGTRVAKNGNVSDGYVCLENLRVDEEKASLGPTAPRFIQAEEEVYDDVEGLQRDLQACDTYNPFTSDTCADESNEETYEDIQSEGYHSTKSEDSKVEKLKRLGKFFTKGKFKMKNEHSKENFRNLSHSVPNLDVIAQETMVYDNIVTEQSDTNSPRNFFKVKKYNFEKNNKMSKEEKLFREKFMYDKEIRVINTAIAYCSNASTKGKLDLKITAGEQIEVIDVTEGNQLICRNSEGKYGYVLLEHLNFRHNTS